MKLKLHDVVIELFVDDFCVDTEPSTTDAIGHARWRDECARTQRNRTKAQEWMDVMVEALTALIVTISKMPPGNYHYEIEPTENMLTYLTSTIIVDKHFDFFTKLKTQLLNLRKDAEKPLDLVRGTKLAALFPITTTFGIPRRAFNEHGAIFGRSGHGKTRTLRSIITTVLQEPDPPALFIMDSLGSLIEGIDKLNLFAASDKWVIIDPEDTPALNFFKLQSDDLFFYLFKAIDQSFTPRQATMISYLMELMQNIEGATLQTLIDVCEGKPIPTVENLSPLTQSFFAGQFSAKKPDPFVTQTKQQIASRLYTLGRIRKV